MRKDIVDHYSHHILLPIETFMKQEMDFHQHGSTTQEQKILKKANDLFLEKLDTFCTLCDDTYQLEEMLDKIDTEKKN